MIGLLAGVPIYLCTQSVDSCKGFYGLTGIVTTAMIRYVKCNTGLAASAAKVALTKRRPSRPILGVESLH